MTTFGYTAEGGTVGATVVSGQTGSGDPLSVAQVTNSATLTIDNAQAAHGTKSIKFTPTTTGQAQIAYAISSTSVAGRIYLYFTAAPTADFYIMRAETGVSATTAPRFVWKSTGKLVLQDAAGAVVWTSTTSVPLNQWVRFGIFAKAGADTATGTLKGGMFLGDSTSPVDPVFSSTTANAGTAPFTRIAAGKTNASQTYATAFWGDDFAVNDAATDLIGPYTAANAAPSANAGPDQANVEPWSTVTLAGSGTDSDGSIASYAWTQTGGAAVTLSGTGATRTFSAPATMGGDTLTFQLTVTDNLGATSTDSVSIGVLTATEFTRSAAGTWIPYRLVNRSTDGAWV